MYVGGGAAGRRVRRRSAGGHAAAARATPISPASSSTGTTTSATCSSAPARARPPRASRSAPSPGSCSASSAPTSSATSSAIGSVVAAGSAGRDVRGRAARSADDSPLHCVDADVEQRMIAEIDARARGRRHDGRQLRGHRARRAARPRQLRAVGSQARRPPGAGADVDPGDQGGRHRPRPARRRRCPGSRIHDEILPPAGARRATVGVARPTNNAGGLEGGVTNGEDLRVTGYMKPIATLMKPLRSVDLDDAGREPGGHRAQRRLRRARRRRRRRSDGRLRPRRRAPSRSSAAIRSTELLDELARLHERRTAARASDAMT